jgi:uracil-DNA glycosylase family 4
MQNETPTRRLLLATMRNYVEQLRDEGLEGLPSRGEPGIESDAGQTIGPDATAAAPQKSQTAVDSSGDSRPAQGKSPVVLARALFTANPGLAEVGDLAALRAYIGDCTRCKLSPTRTNLVFGVGNPKAQLMFVGEGPGAEEDLKGEPFVGRAGQLLTDIIERGIGIRRSEVYIANVVKCRPPGNRNPEGDEVATCEPFLFRQIELVSPKAIVGLGTFAVQALLRVKTPISKLRGVWYDFHGIRLMPTFHPAYLLRNPGDKRLVWADIQEVMRFLGLTAPRRGGAN